MVMHEHLNHHAADQTASDRTFGLTVGGILVALALFRGLFGAGFHALTMTLLVSGAILAAAGLFAAHWLSPLNRWWTRLGLLMARVVNPLVLSLVYLIAVVPTGLVMRWLGHDPLRLRRAPREDSYWIERQPPGPAPESLRDQF